MFGGCWLVLGWCLGLLLLLAAPAPITAPAPPPSLLPPLGWCVVVWVVLCTRTLHLAGYWVVVDMCTRIVLKVEFNLGSGVLGVGCSPSYAIEDCKALKTTPVVVVGSMGGCSVLSGSWYAHPLPWWWF